MRRFILPNGMGQNLDTTRTDSLALWQINDVLGQDNDTKGMVRTDPIALFELRHSCFNLRTYFNFMPLISQLKSIFD
jgi:hypothetical protein